MSTQIRRACVSVAVVTVALAMWYGLYPRGNAPARVDWKNRAIASILAQCNREGAVPVAVVQSSNTSREGAPAELPWIGATRITMANGESVVFRNICQKEDFRVRDLFICKASDGRWYFSPFHFCIGMTVFRYAAVMDGQPASLRSFAQQYALEAFDPESDQSFSKTAPPTTVSNL